MSKSSSASSSKPPPLKSAWAKGPPQASAPSPRSQSPAPGPPPPPHLTHSRRPSALGHAVPIKDGVSIPRNNVGAAAAKQGSPVTFGSIDDASAPISSSPAAPNPIKESVVRSFGTVPAAPAAPSSHINGKPSISASRPVSSALSSPALSAANSVSATPPSAPGPKLDKVDIKRLFQNPSAPAAPSNDTQSPSLRPAALTLQHSQSQNQPSSSQPSQFGAHYPSYVPNRPPPSSGPNNGPSRSPVYQRQMQNGNGPRSQPPNGGPTGLPSPRLGPPHTPQQVGPQAPTPVPGQVQQPAYWAGYYYPPEYMAYPAWGFVPGMQQPGHPHPQHIAQPTHMPPHTPMPISPRNAPHNLPGTPTMSHSAPNPNHPPHPPPPLSHNNSISNVSSPPPTPSSSIPSARLNATSSAFIPRHAPNRVVLKNPEGKEVPLESLASKNAAAPPTTATAPSSGQGSPYRGSSPSTPKRASIRMETVEQRDKRIAEESEKEKERQRLLHEEEEKTRRVKEEAERKERAEEERKEKEKAAEERKQKEKEEQDAQARKAEEARLKQEAEEQERREQEARDLAKREEERKQKEAEEAKLQKEKEEEAERVRKIKEEEEAAAKAEAERIALEEQKKAEDAKKQKEIEEAEKVKAAEDALAATSVEDGEVAESLARSINTAEEPKKTKELLRIDTSTSNPADLGRKRPGPLDLTAAKTSRQSSLSTARNIENINVVKYPDGIHSPKPELNENAKPGHFRYDREFLLQFMSVCKEKPPNLPPLDAIGLEPIDQASLMMSRGGSGRHRNASASTPSRQASTGLNFTGPSGLGKASTSGFPSMGNFGTSGKLTSEDRFALANTGNRAVSANVGAIPFGGRPTAMQRTASGSGQIRERTRSKRGEKRPPAEGGRSGFQHDRGQSYIQQNAQAMSMEPVAPLQPSANRWDRKVLGAVDQDSPELVDRKVKGLLNKLTMEKFDSISDQIITWANKSEQEKDGRTLIQVIRLVFEKATDEATWSEMYARLCRKMMECISPKVQDDGIINQDGKPIAGGHLFRKYLLNRCQEDFERGWVAKEATALAAASKAAEDDAVKAANQSKEEGSEEVALYSEEYYAAQKAKRQGLGLIKFIGELFKLQMLTERIMHECVKKLLGNVDNPEEEEIESLCKLLSTVGALLDTQKARAHMDIYFSRMKELTKSPNVSSRMQFMLQDLLELRERKWIPRNLAAAPTTLAQVHENAAKEKLAIEKESLQRQSGMSRTSSNRGRGRNDFEQQGNPDGWAVAGGGGAPRPQPKAGDLSSFGKITKTQTMPFGPTSVFSKKDSKREQPISRSASNSNMFSMLSQQADATSDAKNEPTQRRKLVLQPRTLPKDEEAPTTTLASRAGSEDGGSDEEDGPAAAPEISDANVAKKIDEDIKELFAVRNLEEAEVYFTTLPSKHHSTLIHKLVSKGVESKPADAELVASFFERATSKDLCSANAFESGFENTAEFIYDIAWDAPKAPQLFARMVKGAGLSEQAQQRIASKSLDSDKVLALFS